jgi:hypothetical protein
MRTKQGLHQAEQLLGVEERHLDVELRELLRAIGPGGLVLKQRAIW